MFGTYSSSMHPSVCVEAVEKLGGYCTCTVLLQCLFHLDCAVVMSPYNYPTGEYFKDKGK